MRNNSLERHIVIWTILKETKASPMQKDTSRRILSRCIFDDQGNGRFGVALSIC